MNNRQATRQATWQAPLGRHCLPNCLPEPRSEGLSEHESTRQAVPAAVTASLAGTGTLPFRGVTACRLLAEPMADGQKENPGMADITSPNPATNQLEVVLTDHTPITPERPTYLWGCTCGWIEDEQTANPNPYGFHLIDALDHNRHALPARLVPDKDGRLYCDRCGYDGGVYRPGFRVVQ